MCALHIVSKDFQLGFAIDLCLVRQQQGPVEHAPVGLLCVPFDGDTALEDAPGSLVQSALVGLLGESVRGPMTDNTGRIPVLPAAQQVGSIEHDLSILAQQVDLDLMAGETGTAVEGQATIAAVAL